MPTKTNEPQVMPVVELPPFLADDAGVARCIAFLARDPAAARAALMHLMSASDYPGFDAIRAALEKGFAEAGAYRRAMESFANGGYLAAP